MSSRLDLAEEIKLDHDNVRELYQRFHDTPKGEIEERAMIANTIIREMAIHSDAEEVSWYNEFQKVGMEDDAEHDKKEHAELKRIVYQLDDMKVDDPKYEKVLEEMYQSFEHHAKEEESEQLPQFISKLAKGENQRITQDFLKARQMVPTRPHPWAPQSGGIVQKAVGMQGKFHDKVIESLGSRQFVELKYQHPDI